MKTDLPLLADGRACGECTACCYSKGVIELDKAGGVDCVHTTKTGCGIYESRPESCKLYTCFWLEGYLEDSERPDKAGFTFDLARAARTGDFVHTVSPAYPDAFKDPSVLYRIKKLAKVLGQPLFVENVTVFCTKKWLATMRKKFGENANLTLV